MQTSLEHKVKVNIENGLEQSMVELETFPTGSVSGHVVSPEFRGLDYEERRARIRAVLEQTLTPEELMKVSTLLTYTPEEWSVVIEDE
jgi:acid stress-induced BolA-like protein IbaG/YrbA